MTKRRPVIASDDQKQRVVHLYKNAVRAHEIYDLVFGYLNEDRNYYQKIRYIQAVLQKAGYIRDFDERSRVNRGNRVPNPKAWKNKSKWSMR